MYDIIDDLNFNCVLLLSFDSDDDYEEEQFFYNLVADAMAWVTYYKKVNFDLRNYYCR